MTFSLRPLRVGDQPEVRRLILTGLEGRWGRLDESLNADLDDIAASYGAGLTLTAWVGQRLVGTGTLVPRATGVAEVLRMSTASEYRGQGIATRILRELLTEARRRGLRSVVLETSAEWSDARSLYERNGFVLDREDEGDFGRDAFYALSLGGTAQLAAAGTTGGDLSTVAVCRASAVSAEVRDDQAQADVQLGLTSQLPGRAVPGA